MQINQASPAADVAEVRILPGFQDFKILFEGGQALYPSEQAARWAIRKLGTELAKAQAVAVHRRALMVHPQRFADVINRAAVERFQRYHVSEA